MNSLQLFEIRQTIITCASEICMLISLLMILVESVRGRETFLKKLAGWSVLLLASTYASGFTCGSRDVFLMVIAACLTTICITIILKYFQKG